jgi:intein/homing endonuclease
MLQDVVIGDKIKSYDKCNNKDIFVTVEDVIDGERELFEITLENGQTITCSMEHRFLCEDGNMRPVKDILALGLGIASAF